MKPLKKIPVILLLLVLFFCLHGTVENYGFIDLREVVLVGLLSLCCLIIFYLIVLLLTNDYLFASLLVFFVGAWYLFFVAIHDTITSTPFLLFLRKYIVLLPALLAITVAWVVLLKRKKAWRGRVLLYFNVLLLIYCSIDTVQLLRKHFSTSQLKPNVTGAFDITAVKSKPNVYFLLFDAYPGPTTLRDSFAFSNENFYSFLKQQEFKILPTYSNYDFTVFSMSSVLNMQYVPADYDPHKLTQHDIQCRVNEIRNGAVFSIFKKMGYSLANYSVFDIDDQHSISGENSFLPVHSRMLTDKILHNRILRTSGKLFENAIPFLNRKARYEHDKDNLYAEKQVLALSTQKRTAPVFCYAHFMMPHDPFYRDSTGKPNPDAFLDDRYNGSKELFLAYLKYTNTVIEKLVNNIRTNDTAAIIVLMSDHGSRFYGPAKKHNPYNHDNFCAVFYPNKNYLPTGEKWSTVNFFRYLFNSQFGQKLPYLDDRIEVIKE